MRKVPFVRFVKGYVEKKIWIFSIAMLALMLLPFFTMSTWAQTQAKGTSPSYTVVLTKDLKKKLPTVKFHCREKVFLAFAWLGLQGKHRVSALWYNPHGKQQDQIDLQFLTGRSKVENWVALKFRDAPDPTNLFLPELFSANLNGKWKVKILLDGNFLEMLEFEVRCE